MKKIAVIAVVLLTSFTVFAQSQHYELRPFACQTGKFVYGFNPVTIGYPGWFCRHINPPLGGFNGTVTCANSVTVLNGIVTMATSGSGC